jgi:hypothetical protein
MLKGPDQRGQYIDKHSEKQSPTVMQLENLMGMVAARS